MGADPKSSDRLKLERPSKSRVLYACAQLEISENGDLSLTVRQQLTRPQTAGQQAFAFSQAGPIVWQQSIFTPLIQFLINQKIKLFE